MMRTSWTLRGRLQYILAKGVPLQIIIIIIIIIMKREEPKGDEYIVSPCLRERVENL